MLPQEELRLQLQTHRSRNALVLEDFHEVRRELVDLGLFKLQFVQPLSLHAPEVGLFR